MVVLVVVVRVTWVPASAGTTEWRCWEGVVALVVVVGVTWVPVFVG